MMLNAIILPISLFWFAFTSWPAVSPWAAIASGIPLGYSLVGIYMYVTPMTPAIPYGGGS